MTTVRSLFVQSQSYIKLTSQQKYQINFDKLFRNGNSHSYSINNSTMSADLLCDLDRKMQKVKEYGLIMHGYRNENIQYPVSVRRSHDGEAFKQKKRTSKLENHPRKNLFVDPIILTSSDENRTKTKQTEPIKSHLQLNENQTTFIVPPNKTVNDIKTDFICDNSHRDRIALSSSSSSSSTNSSPVLCSSRPHITIDISPSTIERPSIHSLSNSSQSLVSQSTQTKTLTRRFFSKIFHYSHKS